MPIYEYECSKCKHKLELIQKISEPPTTQCPDCLQDSLIRLVSAPGFQLKGKGWYATDFKDKPVSSSTTDAKQDTAESKTPSSEKSTEKSNENASATKTVKKEEGK